MKQYRYICDGGALMLGCDDFKCHYMNDYGDGDHNLFVFVSESEFKDVCQAFKFVGHVSGKINVYYYDCDDDDVIVQLDWCRDCPNKEYCPIFYTSFSWGCPGQEVIKEED